MGSPTALRHAAVVSTEGAVVSDPVERSQLGVRAALFGDTGTSGFKTPRPGCGGQNDPALSTNNCAFGRYLSLDTTSLSVTGLERAPRCSRPHTYGSASSQRRSFQRLAVRARHLGSPPWERIVGSQDARARPSPLPPPGRRARRRSATAPNRSHSQPPADVAAGHMGEDSYATASFSPQIPARSVPAACAQSRSAAAWAKGSPQIEYSVPETSMSEHAARPSRTGSKVVWQPSRAKDAARQATHGRVGRGARRIGDKVARSHTLARGKPHGRGSPPRRITSIATAYMVCPSPRTELEPGRSSPQAAPAARR